MLERIRLERARKGLISRRSQIPGIIDKGYARKIEQNELSGRERRVWYIPHHGVYHPNKPGKIRVVLTVHHVIWENS